MTAGGWFGGVVDRFTDRTRLDKTVERLSSLSRLLGVCTSLLWRGGLFAMVATAMVIPILLASRLGLFAGTRPAAEPHVRYADTLRVVTAPDPIPWDKVDTAVAVAAAQSRAKAEAFAAGELDAWNAQLLARIDSDFLPWYFGYWNQQAIGLKAAWQGAKYQLAGYITASDTPSACQQMTADIQQEFAGMVLRPESAQLFLEQLTRKTVDVYLADLRRELAQVQTSYKIPQPRWDRYLEDIAVAAQRTEGARTAPLTLKAVTASSVGAGALAASSLARLAGRLETRLSTVTAEKAGSKMAAGLGEKLAAKAGGKVLARTGSRFLGPAIAVAAIVWDVYDHHQTVSQNSPILRDSLTEYLGLLKESLLHDPQAGLAGPIHEIEEAIVRSVSRDQPRVTLADASH